MSEREYFSLRYTVPGFVFILVVIGLNYSVILNIVTRQGMTDVSSIAVSILSLFASSAIGFLISQIWFSIFHKKRIYAKILQKHGIEDAMKKSFGWNKDKEKSKERDEIMGTSVDYILNYVLKTDQCNLYRFFQRKIDLYHTMSSTWISLIIGLIVGLPLRVCLYFSGYPFDLKIDYCLFGFTIGATIFFFMLLTYLREEIFFEYHPMLKLLFNSKEVKGNKDINLNFRQVFNNIYFDDIEK